MAKKGYNPDGSIDRSQTFTNGNTGVTTYADGSPAPSPWQQANINREEGNKAAFEARGYDMQGNPYGKNPKFLNPKTGRYDLSSPYNEALKKVQAPANLSGGQAAVPTVAQRMSRMGQAVQNGVDKGVIKPDQLNKYQVPGQAQTPTSPLVSQLNGNAGQLIHYGNAGQLANAASGANIDPRFNTSKPAPRPVPMPQGRNDYAKLS